MPGWLTWLAPRRAKAALTPQIEEALRQLGVRHYDVDLLAQDHEWLRREFPRDSKRILAKTFFRNVIWQTHEKIQAATRPEDRPDFYNKHDVIRGMWYYLKPLIDDLPEFKGDHAGRVNEALFDLVQAGVLCYADFNFRDDTEPNRRLGLDNPYVMIVAEKDGFQSMMFNLNATYGAHVITFGGTPGFMSVNTFVSELVAEGLDLTREFVCLSIVDFDPKGTVIMRTFINHLQISGLRNLKTFRQYAGRKKPDAYLDLIRPENLPRGVSYRDVQYNLPKSEQKSWWGRETGGPNGRGDYKHGIEADAFRMTRIQELVEAAIAPHLTVGADAVRKRVGLRSLARALRDFAAYKMTHPTARGPALP